MFPYGQLFLQYVIPFLYVYEDHIIHHLHHPVCSYFLVKVYLLFYCSAMVSVDWKSLCGINTQKQHQLYNVDKMPTVINLLTQVKSATKTYYIFIHYGNERKSIEAVKVVKHICTNQPSTFHICASPWSFCELQYTQCNSLLCSGSLEVSWCVQVIKGEL